MKTFCLVSCLTFLLFVSYAAEAERVSRPSSKPHIRIDALEKEIHALINKERKKNGLPSLVWNKNLASIARKHSKDMAARKFFSHHTPEGHDFQYRYNQAGYTCENQVGRTIYLGAENIALNNLYDKVTTINGKKYYDWNSQERIAETTVQGWMKSSEHRKNILTPYFKSEGIGVVITPGDKVYITQNFC